MLFIYFKHGVLMAAGLGHMGMPPGLGPMGMPGLMPQMHPLGFPG